MNAAHRQTSALFKHLAAINLQLVIFIRVFQKHCPRRPWAGTVTVELGSASGVSGTLGVTVFNVRRCHYPCHLRDWGQHYSASVFTPCSRRDRTRELSLFI